MAGTGSRRRSRRLVLEPLESRTLLTGDPPFSVGGDPIVNPADFRVTTFASGLNYPHGMMTLSDGSLLVAVNNPDQAGRSSTPPASCSASPTPTATASPTAPGRSCINGLPGEVTAVHQAGEFILATSSEAGSERISSSAPARPRAIP